MKSTMASRSEVRSDHSAPDPVGRGLGWFSVALGAAELVFPKTLARWIGADPDGAAPLILRLVGIRELAVGASVLLQPRRPLPLWARVAGDAVDLALVGLAATGRRTSPARLAVTATAIAGVTALDVISSLRATREAERLTDPVIFSVTINKPPREVYNFYRDLKRLPEFMDYLESVEELDAHTSRWTAKTPIGSTRVTWESEIVEDRPGEVIRWQSTKGSHLQIEGRVTFAKTPGRDMTEVRVEMKLGAMGVHPTALVAKLVAGPQSKGDLRRLKQVMETGEVLYSDASSHMLPHPAQPSIEPPEPKRELPFVASEPTAVKGQAASLKGGAR
jgi:uncharacterized membrane protein